MKKIFTITLTIFVFIILIFLISTYFEWYVDPLEESDKNILNLLNRLGNIFLSLVHVVFILILFAIIGLVIPYLSYCIVKLDFDGIKELKVLGLPSIIILGSITLLSIAGVQLRSLKIDNEPTNVRVVDPSFVRVVESNGIPKDIGGQCFYYNDSINDWALTSPPDYAKKKKKSSHLLYRGKSETKYYRKNRFGNWLEVNKMEFNAAKSNGVQTLEYTPIPEINYFLFSDNKWQKINKEEFFKYLKLDSIVRYE
jgi:hypothetical protein